MSRAGRPDDPFAGRKPTSQSAGVSVHGRFQRTPIQAHREVSGGPRGEVGTLRHRRWDRRQDDHRARAAGEVATLHRRTIGSGGDHNSVAIDRIEGGVGRARREFEMRFAPAPQRAFERRVRSQNYELLHECPLMGVSRNERMARRPGGPFGRGRTALVQQLLDPAADALTAANDRTEA